LFGNRFIGLQRGLHVPMPRGPRLLAVCEALLADPARGAMGARPLCGDSGREQPHLGPPVHQELGMCFVDWRAQARLAFAIARLAEGD